jgi:mersacidin/lichenicidin family type 2 lantibiotic
MQNKDHFGGTMSKKIDTIRAWKDQEYRDSLTADERASLSEMPIGNYELDPEIMENVVGGDICTLWSVVVIPSEGAVCTISGECNGSGRSCNPLSSLTGDTGASISTAGNK